MTLSPRQIQRILQKLNKKAGGCDCGKEGYLQAIRDMKYELVIKQKETKEND